MSHETIHIKPIVLFAISEHYKRKSIQHKSNDFLILGCLYGQRDKLVININFSAPIRATESERQNKIEKGPFGQYLIRENKLVTIDHPGNNLRNLELVGIYILRKNIEPTSQDKEVFDWLHDLGFENQRLLLMNFDGKYKIHIYKKDHDRLVQIPYSNTIQNSETISIKALNTQSKHSPYLTSLDNQRKLLQNYTEKLVHLNYKLQTQTNPEQLRKLSTILSAFEQLSEEESTIKQINSSIVYTFSVALNLEKAKLPNSY